MAVIVFVVTKLAPKHQCCHRKNRYQCAKFNARHLNYPITQVKG